MPIRLSEAMIIESMDGKLYPYLYMRVTQNLGGMHGDIQSSLDTLEFKNGEQVEYFRNITIIL